MADLLANIVPIKEILDNEKSVLIIPSYQRPYVWEQENVYQLLNDINTYRNANKKKYLIGSLILFNDKENENKPSEMEIIDGQQRITTLSLIHNVCQDTTTLHSNQELKYNHEESFTNIANNYKAIKTWVSQHIGKDNDKKLAFWNYIYECCYMVKIVVYELGEAFQMFDTQNGRGKPLLPYNLLKAYHIRAMEQNTKDEKMVCDRRWESATQYNPDFGNKKIKNIDILDVLFDNHLYKARVWSKQKNAGVFTKKKVGEFKGFTIDRNHPIKFPYQNPQLLQYLTEKFYHSVLEGTMGTESRFTDGDPDNINPFTCVTQEIVNGKLFFDYIETYTEIYKRMFVEVGSHELAKFKNFYYKCCLNYDCKIDDADAQRTKNAECYKATGVARRIGDTCIREMYKTILLCLFDKFGEKVLNQYYKVIYRIIYSKRISTFRIDPAAVTVKEHPRKCFDIIYNAKSNVDLNELNTLLNETLSNLEESSISIHNDVKTFIKYGKYR